jgi:hypothetical protein
VKEGIVQKEKKKFFSITRHLEIMDEKQAPKKIKEILDPKRVRKQKPEIGRPQSYLLLL